MQRQGPGCGEADDRGGMGSGRPPPHLQYPPKPELSPLARLVLARFGVFGQAGEGFPSGAFPGEKSNNSAKVNNAEGDNTSMGRSGLCGHSSANEGGSDRADGRGGANQRSEDNSIRGGPQCEVMGVEQHWSVAETVQALGIDRSGLWKPGRSANDGGDKAGLVGRPLDPAGQGTASSPGPENAFQKDGFWKQQQHCQRQSQNGAPGPDNRSFCGPQPCGFAAWDRQARDRGFEHKESAAYGEWPDACQQGPQSETADELSRHRHAMGRALASDLPGESRNGVPFQHTVRYAMGEQSWRRLRSVMLKQQEQFMNQLWELHRVHWLQGFLEAVQGLNEQIGLSAPWHSERAAAMGLETTQPNALQQAQPQYSQNLARFWQQVLGDIGRWVQANADASITSQGQNWLAKLCQKPLAFPQPSCQPQFVLPGHRAPLSGSSAAGSSPECPVPVPVPVMPPPINDHYALWYAKHYDQMAKAPWAQQSSGVDEQEACGNQQVEGAPAMDNAVDVPLHAPPAPLDSMAGTAVAAAKAVTEANPQRWWQDAARMLGDVLKTANQASAPSGKTKGKGHRGGPVVSSSKGQSWHNKDQKRASKRVHAASAKGKQCISGAMVEASAENSIGSNRQVPLVQEEPLSTKKSGLACVKKVSKRKNGQRASRSSRLHKQSRRSRPSQLESIGSDLSATCNDVEDADAVNKADGESGGHAQNDSSFPQSMASILLSLSAAPVQ